MHLHCGDYLTNTSVQTTSPFIPNNAIHGHNTVPNRGTQQGRGQNSRRQVRSHFITTTAEIPRHSMPLSQSVTSTGSSPAKLARERGEHPTGAYQLPAPWHVIRSAYNEASRNDAFSTILTIGRRTQCLIEVPAGHLSVLQIWGHADRVERAREELDKLISTCRLMQYEYRSTLHAGDSDQGLPPVTNSTARHVTEEGTQISERGVNGRPHQLSNGSPAKRTPRPRPESSARQMKYEWVKVNAYHDWKEAGNAERELRKQRDEEFCKPLTIVQELPFEVWTMINARCIALIALQLFFLWPSDVCSFEHFKEDFDQSTVQELRRVHRCYIQYDAARSHIQVLSHSYESVIAVYRRLRGIVVDIVSKMGARKRLYLLNGPLPPTMRNRIGLSSYQAPAITTAMFRPFLTGSLLDEQTLLDWSVTRFEKARQNKQSARRIVEEALQSIRVSRQYVRMEVGFGIFLLSRFRRPEDEKDMHGFEEFRLMLGNSNTRGELQQNLDLDISRRLTMCSQAEDLFSPLDINAETLQDIEPVYSVCIEFPSRTSALKLEVEFVKSRRTGVVEMQGSKESPLEISQRRWLETSCDANKERPLELAMIDFERCDWELKLEVADIYDNERVSASLSRFANEVIFIPSAGTAQRRVTFPMTSQPIQKVIERTTYAYELKGTDYIFELTRYDTFIPETYDETLGRNNPMLASQNISKTSTYSTWDAKLRHRDWDNLLAEHAQLKPGEPAKWSNSLQQFFPTRPGTTIPETSQGFWEFWDHVERIAAFLRGSKKEEFQQMQEQPGAGREGNAALGEDTTGHAKEGILVEVGE